MIEHEKMTVDFWHLKRETSDLEIITKHEGLPIIIFAINCFDAHQFQFMRASMHAFALEFMNQIAILEKMNANYESKVVHGGKNPIVGCACQRPNFSPGYEFFILATYFSLKNCSSKS